jgi:hypothetical protein
MDRLYRLSVLWLALAVAPGCSKKDEAKLASQPAGSSTSVPASGDSAKPDFTLTAVCPLRNSCSL